MENPDNVLSNIGHVDIPITLDDSECIFAYEDYLDNSDGYFSQYRNCDLYDGSDPRVL
jgi:hypothetical protein